MKAARDFLGKSAPPGYVAGAGRKGFTTCPDAVGEADMTGPGGGPADDDSGDAGLLSRDMDPEDAEADRVFTHIDSLLSSRRRHKNKEPEGGAGGTKSDPRDMFADLRASLGRVSAEEWAALPEASDRRAKKRHRGDAPDRFTPLPDSILLSRSDKILHASIADEEGALIREKMLGSSLDSQREYKGQKSDYSLNEYLERLSSQVLSEDSLERAKRLVRGMLRCNPDNPSTWIAAIRLELGAGRLKTARSIARQAVDRLPQSAELWLEYSSVAEDRRSVLQKAITNSSASGGNWEDVWAMATENEETLVAKQVTLRKGLKAMPHSAKLWSLLVNDLGSSDERLYLLAKACEACPQHAPFWIALSQAETGDNVRRVLNMAARKIPGNLDIWLQVVRHDPSPFVVRSAVEQCRVSLKDTDFPDTPEARLIIRELFKEAESLSSLMLSGNKVVRECAVEAVFANECQTEEKCVDMARKSHSLVDQALRLYPMSVDLWLIKLGDEPGRGLFEEAVSRISEERVWCMYLDCFPERDLALRAHLQCPGSPAIAYRYLLCLLQGGHLPPCDQYSLCLEQFAATFPTHQPILLLYSAAHRDDEELLKRCVKECPLGVHLWIRLCLGSLSKSVAAFRAVWERANKAIPRSELLWLCLLRHSLQPSLLSQSLRECPRSGLLQAFAIEREGNREVRKAKALDCLKTLGSDPNVLCLIGRLLGAEGRSEEGEEYMQRALRSAGPYADIYALYSAYHAGDAEKVAEARQSFDRNRPTISMHFLDRMDFSFDELLKRCA